jgi:hypothetical protein
MCGQYCVIDYIRTFYKVFALLGLTKIKFSNLGNLNYDATTLNCTGTGGKIFFWIFIVIPFMILFGMTIFIFIK